MRGCFGGLGSFLRLFGSLGGIWVPCGGFGALAGSRGLLQGLLVGLLGSRGTPVRPGGRYGESGRLDAEVLGRDSRAR